MLTNRMHRWSAALCVVLAAALAGCGAFSQPLPTAPPRVGPLPTPVPSATIGAPAALPPTATGPALPSGTQVAASGAASAFDAIGTPAVRQPTATPKLTRVNRLPTIAERPIVAQLPLAPRYAFTEAISGTTPVLMIAIPGEISFRAQTLGARPGGAFPRYSIAPNQRFLAYYSGSAGACCSLEQATEFDRAITIVSMLDGSVLANIRQLSTDFPKPLLRGANEDRIGAERAYGALLPALDIGVWAPDSTTFYFAGLREGDHSDVYAIDVLRGTSQRISDAPGEIASFSISPDRRWLLMTKRKSADENTATVIAARLDGSQTRELGANWGGFVGWAGPNSGALARRDGVSGLRDLSVFDLERGILRKTWDGPIFDAVSEPNGGALVFCSPRDGALQRIAIRSTDLSAAPDGACN
jgi:hypothetical protein